MDGQTPAGDGREQAPVKPRTDYRYFQAVTATFELCGGDGDVTHQN